jgi:hypothetical protein
MLPYVWACNSQLPFLKHPDVVVTNLLGRRWLTCYRQLSTCRFKFHPQVVLPPHGTMVKWTDDQWQIFVPSTSTAPIVILKYISHWHLTKSKLSWSRIEESTLNWCQRSRNALAQTWLLAVTFQDHLHQIARRVADPPAIISQSPSYDPSSCEAQLLQQDRFTRIITATTISMLPVETQQSPVFDF